MAIKGVTHITQIVSDQDAALDWYTKVLGCEKRMDQSVQGEEFSMRWLTVGFPESPVEISLQPPMAGLDGRPAPKIGDGLMTVLGVDDCRATVARLKEHGANVVAEPEDLAWGVSAVVRDLDGNPYNLVEARQG